MSLSARQSWQRGFARRPDYHQWILSKRMYVRLCVDDEQPEGIRRLTGRNPVALRVQGTSVPGFWTYPMRFSSDSNAFSTSSSSQTASLPFTPIESILPTATPSNAGTKRGPVPKRRFQKGTFVKRGNNWVGMWRIDTLQPDGSTKREQRSKTFVGLSERAARAALQPVLDAVNAANHATPPVPKTSDTVAKAVSEWRE